MCFAWVNVLHVEVLKTRNINQDGQHDYFSTCKACPILLRVDGFIPAQLLIQRLAYLSMGGDVDTVSTMSLEIKKKQTMLLQQKHVCTLIYNKVRTTRESGCRNNNLIYMGLSS